MLFLANISPNDRAPNSNPMPKKDQNGQGLWTRRNQGELKPGQELRAIVPRWI